MAYQGSTKEEALNIMICHACDQQYNVTQRRVHLAMSTEDRLTNKCCTTTKRLSATINLFRACYKTSARLTYQQHY